MDSHFFYRKKITFILSNEHVYDLNVQYDLIWWEYAWMDFKPGMWISYMALEIFRITNLHCCQTHCTFLPILNSGFLIQTGNQYILFKKWNEFQIIRLIIEIWGNRMIRGKRISITLLMMMMMMIKALYVCKIKRNLLYFCAFCHFIQNLICPWWRFDKF